MSGDREIIGKREELKGWKDEYRENRRKKELRETGKP